MQPTHSDTLLVNHHTRLVELSLTRLCRAQEEVQGPTCGVDDLTIWKLIYGPGATLSYTSDSEEETLESHSQRTVNFTRLMGGECMTRSVTEEE